MPKSTNRSRAAKELAKASGMSYQQALAALDNPDVITHLVGGAEGPWDYSEIAVAAMERVLRGGGDFSDWLATALARLAARNGGSDVLVAGRPGSWEAAGVVQLLRGTVGDDEYLETYLPDGSERIVPTVWQPWATTLDITDLGALAQAGAEAAAAAIDVLIDGVGLDGHSFAELRARRAAVEGLVQHARHQCCAFARDMFTVGATTGDVAQVLRDTALSTLDGPTTDYSAAANALLAQMSPSGGQDVVDAFWTGVSQILPEPPLGPALYRPLSVHDARVYLTVSNAMRVSFELESNSIIDDVLDDCAGVGLAEVAWALGISSGEALHQWGPRWLQAQFDEAYGSTLVMDGEVVEVRRPSQPPSLLTIAELAGLTIEQARDQFGVSWACEFLNYGTGWDGVAAASGLSREQAISCWSEPYRQQWVAWQQIPERDKTALLGSGTPLPASVCRWCGQDRLDVTLRHGTLPTTGGGFSEWICDECWNRSPLP